MRHSLPVRFAAAPRCFVRLLFFCGCKWSLEALQLLLWGREGSPRSLSATLPLQSCPPSARLNGVLGGDPEEVFVFVPTLLF